MKIDVKGKICVVTGSTKGIGKGIAEALAENGGTVVICSRKQNECDAVAAEIREKYGVDAIGVSADITKTEAIENLFNTVMEKYGRVDVLVNNAGIMDDMSPIGDVEDERYERVMKTNVYGPMCAMRKAVDVFTKQESGGTIINIASVGGMRSVAGAVYCASKAALISMTKNTAFMYAPQGIRCNAIAPGGIETEISTSMGMPNMNGYGRVQTVLAAAPKPGPAQSIANAALFLASDESSYVNGDVLVVDGGWIAG